MKKKLSYTLILLLQIAQAQHSNIRISNPLSTTPEEVTIAVNPTNPLNIAAGANIYFSYHSTDGGLTWMQQSLISADFGVWGDPSVVFDDLGNLYFGHLSNPPPPGYWIDRIVIQRSTNGGQTWNNGVGVGYSPPAKNQDKEWLASDLTNSIYRNNLYMAWTEFDSYGSHDPADSSRILFSRSTDHGFTWTFPIKVSDVGGNCVDSDSTVEGAVPAVGPAGEVYLSWSGPPGIMFDKSTDGGATFGRDIFVASQPGGWDFGISGIYRANGMPITACDVSNSSYRGNIYINWSDQRNGEDNTDIYFSKSTDGGQTWSAVKKVNDDLTARQQFFTWMTIDQSDGSIYIVFYDRRNTTGDATDVCVAKSVDGGESFVNFKISDSSFTPTQTVFFGDYIDIAAMNGKAYPIWMRLDGTNLSIWTAIIDERKTVDIAADSGWNMVSIPLKMDDYRRERLFPSASSTAFAYNSSYFIVDSLKNGKGYWLKFPAGEINPLIGRTIETDSLDVSAGWNMIGSISLPAPTSKITGNIPGLTTSDYYTYNGSGYSVADTIKPGDGYWVKVNKPGRLILSQGAMLHPVNPISMIPTHDLPPAPPIMLETFVPGQFVLEQNYPNPFNPTTKIRFTIPDSRFTTLKVYDVLGREVMTLANEYKKGGSYEVELNASVLPSGVYFYRLVAGGYVSTKKFILMK